MTSSESGAPGDTGEQVPYVSPVPRRRVLLRNSCCSRWTVVSKETRYEGLVRKSDGEWAGRRQPFGAGSCCAAVGLGSGGGVGDDRFAVADGDVLAGERLELGGQVAGAAMLVDPGFVVAGPEIAKSGVRV